MLLSQAHVHTGFEHRHFYTQKPLHTEAFTHTHKPLHTDTFTHTCLHTRTPLHTGIVTNRLYTQPLLHKEVFYTFSQKGLYAKTHEHTDAFQMPLRTAPLHVDSFTHGRFYTHRCLYKQTL